MSYSYSLFLVPAPGSMETWLATEPPPIGNVDAVKRILARCYPEMAWEQSNGSWFSLVGTHGGYPECQITPESNGEVLFLTMRRAERSEVEEVCRQMGTVAVDVQTMDLYSAQADRWSRGA